jgi:ribonuclease HII
MSSTNTGRQAEAAVADYLRQQGFKILDQNWRTRWCEIDVVVEKNQVVYFVEVKYRRTTNQGSGLEYVTGKKQEQMSFAAESWVHEHNWHGEYGLAAAAVAGADFQVTDFIAELF